MGSGTILPRIKQAVTWVELDDEVVVYDEVRRSMHLLNPDAAAIWKRLDGRASLDEIAADLSDAYRANQRQMAKHVADLVDQLIRRGLLEGAPG